MVALRFSGVLLVVLVLAVSSETNGEGSSDDGDDVSFESGEVKSGLDNEYQDYDSGVYLEHQVKLNFTLRKCFCPSNGIWNGSSCENQNTQVVLFKFLGDNGFYHEANTTAFSNVLVSEAACPDGAKFLDLYENSVASPEFVLLESGELYWNDIKFENYCLEHVYDSAGQPHNWFAQVCLESLVVPKCCPQGQSLDAKGLCVITGVQEFSPPVTGTWFPLDWPFVIDEFNFENGSCSDSEEMSLQVIDNETTMLVYHPDKPYLVVRGRIVNTKYCINVKAEGNPTQPPLYVAKLCYRDLIRDHAEKCRGRTCVRKCCLQSEYMAVNDCVPLPEDSEAKEWFQIEFRDHSSLTKMDEPDNLTIIEGEPLCKHKYKLMPQSRQDDIFHILQNGYLSAESLSEPFPPTRYCLESIMDEYGEVQMEALVCFPDLSEKSTLCPNLQSYLYPALVFISIVFLGFTILVHVYLPETHAAVHGRCQLCHTLALLMASISLFINNVASGSLPSILCRFMGSFLQFSFLATFFWLNILCFDIWWTLKSMRPSPETGEKSRLRFKVYSLYSWGCPLIITLLTVVIQEIPDNINVIRPYIGFSRCWFDRKLSLWAYFYGIILALILINIYFFCHLAYILLVKHNDPLVRTKERNRERLWLYLKLFLVMGITWLAEVISWQEGTCEAWIVMDIVNSLRGLFVFIAFTYKKKHLRKVRVKLDPYIRQVKEVVGLKKLVQGRFVENSNTMGKENDQSLSSSDNPRVSHSSTSLQRTSDSQVTTTESTSRKLSDGLLVTSTGVEVHFQGDVNLSRPEVEDSGVSSASVVIPVETYQEETSDGHITSNQVKKFNVLDSRDVANEALEDVLDTQEFVSESQETLEKSSNDLNVKECVADDQERKEPETDTINVQGSGINDNLKDTANKNPDEGETKQGDVPTMEGTDSICLDSNDITNETDIIVNMSKISQNCGFSERDACGYTGDNPAYTHDE